MNFVNSGNNNDTVSTNTTIMTLYSDLSSLTIGAWNDKINIRFNPSIGKDGNGLTQYDRDKKISTAISQSNASALLKKVNEKILPVYQSEEKTPVNVGVMMGRSDAKNVLVIEYKPDESGDYRFFLTLAQNVTSSNKTIISYKFNQTDVACNFDNETGQADGVEKVESEFDNFVEILRRRFDIMPNSAHSIRHSNNIGKKYANNNGNGFGGSQGFKAPEQYSGLNINEYTDALPFN